MSFIILLLTYLETPQYLRKRLFKIEPRLQFAGILPPLRTPHHPVSGKTADLKVGDYREGLVLSKEKEGLFMEIGGKQPALLREKQHILGERLTVQIIKVGERIEVQAVDREDAPTYWGYRVRGEESFCQFVIKKDYDLTIATARLGDKFIDVEGEIGKKWNKAQNVLIAFGAPSRGLHEIAKAEGKKLETIVDFVVNTIPKQGTATVRTEEAILASIAIFNEHFNS